MYEYKKCRWCGSTQMVTGSILSTGKTYFRPDHVKFTVPKTASVSVRGLMCLDCGGVELVADTKKARSLLDYSRN